ncbi:60S ribosomal protein L35 [Cryptosporidium canis]|uniref:60S ribosomal protein L35 n=1 Tax=Cryptosporidium canis TaxID=195482 RepID=A0A9D5DIQ4_9CRYT|nr:60S ribosomal protein L35 [Cryptosporidium canis]KAJ1610847.1 60S ribosomal protein L35 [Cryptosporidium canis]KAJ1611930.1 60S ribosomal protein L35 [Cryptosporidium canis]
MNKNSQLQAKQLVSLSEEELTVKIDELKKELASLRVIQSTGTAPNKLSRISVVRKAIARILTILSQRNIKKLREKHSGSKFLPLDLRKKLTRAKRRALTPQQAKKMTVKASKKALNFPKRKFAIIA